MPVNVGITVLRRFTFCAMFNYSDNVNLGNSYGHCKPLTYWVGGVCTESQRIELEGTYPLSLLTKSRFLKLGRKFNDVWVIYEREQRSG